MPHNSAGQSGREAARMAAIGRTKCYSVRSLTRARPVGRGWHPGGLGVGLATVPRSTAIHNSCKADVEGSGTAGTEKEKSGPFSSIRIVLDWRGKHPAVDASGVSRAGRACLTVRRAKRLCMTSIPRFADVGSPVLFRRGMCRRDHSNNRQRSCVHRQCEEPYRKFAHASLPLMRKRSWIGSLGRYSYSMLVCCGRMAASAFLPRKPARGWQWSRASPR